MKTKIALAANAKPDTTKSKANIDALSPLLVKAFGKITEKSTGKEYTAHDHQGASVQIFYFHDGKIGCFINLPQGIYMELPKPISAAAFKKRLSTLLTSANKKLEKQIAGLQEDKENYGQVLLGLQGFRE